MDEILEVGKICRNLKGIGFEYNSMSQETKVPIKNFVPLMKKTEFLMVDHMSQQPTRHMYPQYIGYKNSFWRCHHCGRYGMI